MTLVFSDRPSVTFLGAEGGSTPPLLLLHKTGGDEHELQPLARAVAPERPVIALRGADVQRHDIAAGHRRVEADAPAIRTWLSGLSARRAA